MGDAGGTPVPKSRGLGPAGRPWLWLLSLRALPEAMPGSVASHRSGPLMEAVPFAMVQTTLGTEELPRACHFDHPLQWFDGRAAAAVRPRRAGL
jgi:hypothetical protein